MNILSLYHKRISVFNRLRGLFFQIFIQGKGHNNLQLSRNVEIWGTLHLGKNVYLGSNVKIYKKNTISDNVHIGDNVELRCNGGNSILIGKNCTINRGSLIMGTVQIGNNCLIAPLCVIVGSNHNFNDVTTLINEQGISSKGIKIGDNVWLGAQVTVVDGVCIGDNTIIGAGSVVTKNIPANSIAVGNPCKVIKSRHA
ncbi:acyltransferase [Algibacter mikhailovii]|uniref:Acyltransferase n=1 Tax=Algibacter mikhailovii TaxID=425498 RepID=A0A918RDU2_9FLAO|nr:acyltransferase [Algibacter mikhailovii]GGZ93617.1 hypothetical protein GCM10007028_35040 [Algibacter mikhailovii]